MRMVLVLYSVPVVAVAVVIWAVLIQGMPDAIRRTTMVAAIVVACVPVLHAKTWNRLVVARDILLVCNGQEMAHFGCRSRARLTVLR